MAGSTQVTQSDENNLFGGKNESGLIRFSIHSFLIIATFVWFQSGNLNQSFLSLNSYYASSDFAVNFTSPVFATALEETKYPVAVNQSVYLTNQKNGIGSDDDPVRFNPESKNLTGILEPIVNLPVANAEVVDASIHPENYTPKTSKAIMREAVNQRSDTSFKQKTIVAKKEKEEPFGSVVYHGEHFKEMPTYVQKSSAEIVEQVSKPVARFASLKNETKVKETVKESFTSTLSTIKIASLKLSNIAAHEEVASINSSDNASTTKQQDNQLHNLKVDEPEAAIASFSLTDELIAKTGITSTQFHELSVKASADEKMLLVRFNATWCAPCKMMERDVYANTHVKAFMDQHFLSMKVDIGSFDGINLKQKFDVESLPSFLLFNSKGELVVHNKESLSSKKMLKLLKKQVKQSDRIDSTNSLSKSENDNENSDFDTGPITRSR